MGTKFQKLALFAILIFTSQTQAKVCFEPRAEDRSKWAYEAGVLWISDNDIHEILTGHNHFSESPGGGQIYSLTAAYRWGDLTWGTPSNSHHVEFELPQTFEIGDEKSKERSPFLTYNSSFFIRVVEFPWNRYVVTTFGTGVGITVMSRVPEIDIERHPGDRDRSRVKFNWPIQLTLALPSHPEHQLMVFIGHHSGGHIFDVGGFNSLGLGYRFAL